MFKGLSTSVAVGVPVIVGTVVLASPVLKKLAEKSEAGAWLVVGIGVAAMVGIVLL
jgi:hypothetical protein